MDRPEEISTVLAQFLDDVERGQAHVADAELVAASSRTRRAGELADVLRGAVQASAGATTEK
jgi:hypothetical protein